MTNWAEYAKSRGWGVGTVLIGSPIIRDGKQIESGRRIRITALGESTVLAVCEDHGCWESSWEFSSREWTEVQPSYLKARVRERGQELKEQIEEALARSDREMKYDQDKLRYVIAARTPKCANSDIAGRPGNGPDRPRIP